MSGSHLAAPLGHLPSAPKGATEWSGRWLRSALQCNCEARPSSQVHLLRLHLRAVDSLGQLIGMRVVSAVACGSVIAIVFEKMRVLTLIPGLWIAASCH